MDEKEEFRRYLKAAAEDLRSPAALHLDEAELIDYQQGRLSAVQRERVQSHLVQCDTCLALFQDIKDFLEPLREGEITMGDVGVRREWNLFQERVRGKEDSIVNRAEPVRTADTSLTNVRTRQENLTRAAGLRLFGFSLGMQASLALAASLILAVGLTGGWALWLQQERKQLARQLEMEKHQRLDRERQMEQDNRQLQQQAAAVKHKYESQLAELGRPQVNVPIYDVFSKDSVQRSGSQSEGNRLSLPRSTAGFALILNGAGQPEYPGYVVEIVDQKDQMVWRGVGLKRDNQGNFVITIGSTFLSEGEYRFRLYGQRGERPVRIAEYRVIINPLPG